MLQKEEIKGERWSLPDVGTGFLLDMGSSSLMSITTALDVRKTFATEAACSKQHLTTCFKFSYMKCLLLQLLHAIYGHILNDI